MPVSPEKTDTTKNVLNQLVGEQLANQPSPNETVVESLINKEATQDEQSESVSENSNAESGIFGQPITEEITDATGTVFDSSIHCVDEQGNPKRTKTGKFRRKRGATGSERKSTSNRTNGGPVNGSIGQSTDETRRQCRLQADMIHSSVEYCAVALLGDHWSTSPQERDRLVEALTTYLVETGQLEIPAWFGLAMAYGIYALPRYMDERTQQRLDELLGKSQTPEPME